MVYLLNRSIHQAQHTSMGDRCHRHYCHLVQQKRPFEDQVDITQKGFVRVKLGNVHFYSVYVPPSLTINKFKDLLDRLVMDARKHSPRVLAGDFNAWAAEWGSKKTGARGNELLQAMSCLDMVLLNTGMLTTCQRDD